MHAGARADVVDALARLPVAEEIRLRAFAEWAESVGEQPDLWEILLIVHGFRWRDRAACELR